MGSSSAARRGEGPVATAPPQRPDRPHLVAVVAVHGAAPLELAIPTAVFDRPGPEVLRSLPAGHAWYEVSVCAAAPHTTAHPLLAAPRARPVIDLLTAADTVVVAAGPEVPPQPGPEIRWALRRAHERGARIVGVGSGAFVLAAAGLLAGRRATTHWSVCAELRRLHPDVVVGGSALYVGDRGIYTSAGGAATLDLCIELVREDHGAAVANALARWHVAPPHRGGNQPQRVTTPVPESEDRLSVLLEWAAARLDQPLTLAAMAQAAGVSPRTLARRFHAALGTTPLQWLLAQRIRLAQELLESTDHPIDRIAERSGFGSPGNLRQQFTKTLGMSPRRYRRTFRGQASARSGPRSA